jgi:hypothetical protein
MNVMTNQIMTHCRGEAGLIAACPYSPPAEIALSTCTISGVAAARPEPPGPCPFFRCGWPVLDLAGGDHELGGLAEITGRLGRLVIRA